MRLARCHRVLGVPVTQADVGRIFGSLGLEYTIEGDDFVVTPPSFRFDIEIEEDLIEEVARIYGFENIPTVPPMARAKMFSQPESVAATTPCAAWPPHGTTRKWSATASSKPTGNATTPAIPTPCAWSIPSPAICR